MRTGQDAPAPPTPADWARTHPDYRLERSTGEYAFGWPPDVLDDEWCVRATRRTLTTGGRAILRQARFYPPSAPDPPQLPAVSHRPGRDFEDCRLGSISITAAFDSASATEIEVVQAGLRVRLGDYVERHAPLDVATARKLAVHHYQRVLDLMPPSGERQAVWRKAWRLAAGLPPLQWTYLCSHE